MNYKTSQRKRLQELFASAPNKAFTAKEISSMLSDANISTSAIYRNLAALVQEGTIKRSVIKNNREALYQYVGCSHHCDKIHLSCVVCGKITHIDVNTSAALEKSISRSDGFRIDHTKTVIYGTCKSCQQDI